MCPFIYLLRTLGAQTEGLVRLMTGHAGTPIRSQALEKRVVFINMPSLVERRRGASLVLEALQVRNGMDYRCRAQTCKERQDDCRSIAQVFHISPLLIVCLPYMARVECVKNLAWNERPSRRDDSCLSRALTSVRPTREDTRQLQ